MKEKARKNGMELEIDSAGFESFHVGDGADPRSFQTAANHGIDIGDHVARRFRVSDFDHYDRIYVMDSTNYRDVMGVARNQEDVDKVDFMLNLVRPGSNTPVPDPYYGGRDGFEKVYGMLDEACDILIEDIKEAENQN